MPRKTASIFKKGTGQESNGAANQEKQIFLLCQISPSASSTRDLGTRLFSDAILDRGVALDTINLNIRWHQTQLLPWDFAYAYVTSGLHTYFSDISISISISIRKWKRFLFLMLMLMLMSLPVYTAYAYAYVYACAYAYVAV